VDQRDVYLDLPVAPWEAVLGAQVRAPTPGGTLELTVPPGSVSGRKLRVRGRGIPGTPPGDFYFVLQIALPVAEQAQAQEAYRAFAAQFAGFDPRARLGATP
jgi:curved DNA-binding protein